MWASSGLPSTSLNYIENDGVFLQLTLGSPPWELPGGFLQVLSETSLMVLTLCSVRLIRLLLSSYSFSDQIF